ncbi:MAG: DUF1800 domain-containing protein [Ardenticatenales bacterium]
MALTRRTFLATSAAGAALAAVEAPHAPRLRAAANCGPMPEPSAIDHLLSRATFGVTAAERARAAAMGADAWIEEQLAPATIDDHDCDDALAALPTLALGGAELKVYKDAAHPVSSELTAATLYRAVASRRQLFEVMVDHWSNHFNIFMPEEFIVRYKTVDDREVVRKHALGQFRDMVHASSKSPVMMRYLNVSANTRNGPNENYARELMELHTLGVGGGYTEQDVKAVARCFTGWNWNADVAFEFRPADHVPGDKIVLGKRIPEGGAAEAEAVIDLLVDQPSCATHVARRLVRRFVSDTPPDSLIQSVAAAFGRDGDIKAMVRVLLRSPEFAAATTAQGGGPAKIRRPLEQWAACLRALECDAGALLAELPKDVYEGGDRVAYEGRAEAYLQQMDQLPFRWRAPDGYPDSGRPWSGMHVMVGRWNFAQALCAGELHNMPPYLYELTVIHLADRTAERVVDDWAMRILPRGLTADDRMRLVDFLGNGRTDALDEATLRARLPLTIAAMLDSPYFSWR